jgi:ribosomal-protein-alanine N-acetyltransferase
MTKATGPELQGARVLLRPLALADFEQYREVRHRCRDWLVKWEPRSTFGHPDAADDRRAFAALCGARDRERQLGTGYGFAVCVPDDAGGLCFGGVMNLSSIQRGPFQNAYVGYWIDEARAGQGYTPEALVCVLRFAFEQLLLHRLQIAIIPRNTPSRRVVEKLNLRNEGIAERYLQINGRWEDHVRYAITAEEWSERAEPYTKEWLTP